MKILITGASGFVGKNLVSTLKSTDHEIMLFDKSNSLEDLDLMTRECDFVYHLAGVNRPTNPEDFYLGNAGLTETLTLLLQKHHNHAPILITSSIQAKLDNDYGKSKKEGEDIVIQHGKNNQSKVYVYRLKNLFGKWSQPNYNTVIATWCYNVSRGQAVHLDAPDKLMEFSYIDDVIEEFLNALEDKATHVDDFCEVPVYYERTLGYILDNIISFKDSRHTFKGIKTGDAFIGKLYATYLSFLPINEFSYPLKMNIDNRGSFSEFIKTDLYGQVSVNISKPGITKGNHWHHTKNEKFLVVSGKGIIRFRNIITNEIVCYEVSSEKLEVIDIPTGYTHNIENLGDCDMVTIMWASEQFDPGRPDTIFEEV